MDLLPDGQLWLYLKVVEDSLNPVNRSCNLAGSLLHLEALDRTGQIDNSLVGLDADSRKRPDLGEIVGGQVGLYGRRDSCIVNVSPQCLARHRLAAYRESKE